MYSEKRSSIEIKKTFTFCDSSRLSHLIERRFIPVCPKVFYDLAYLAYDLAFLRSVKTMNCASLCLYHLFLSMRLTSDGKLLDY